MTEERKPFFVQCSKCKHCWPAAYYPMEVSAWARIVMKAICPMCGCTKGHTIPKQADGKLTEPVHA